MKNYWVMKIAKMIVLFAAFILLAGWVTMGLWNWLMPYLFGLPTVTFVDALGILILAKILFGLGGGGRWGWHGGHYGGHGRGYYWKQKMEDKLKNMSPEDRDKFREEWRKRCGWKWEDKTEEEKKEN